MAKKFDPKAKAKRQKIILGVLALVLVGVLAFQAPTILGAFGGSSSTTDSEPSPAPAAAPTSATAAAPVAAAPGANGVLIDSDPAPSAAVGQLVTFDRFESKDPFVQQVDNNADGSGGAGGGGTVPAEPAANADDRDGFATVPEPAPSARVPASAPAAAPSPATATISINGVSEEVKRGSTFPEAGPVFKLVAVTRSAVKVGIVGGGYANGSQTVTLAKGGKPVTLMNTADGTTYVLRLLRVG